MPTFKYKARNQIGSIIEGEMEATSKAECVQNLRNSGLFIIAVEENTILNKEVLNKEINFGAVFAKLFGRYSYKRLASFCGNLNFLLQSGLTVYKAIGLIKDQSDKRMKKVLEQVEQDLDAGFTFHEALAKHPTVFPKFVIELIRSGEMSSSLEKITEELANYYEEQQLLRSQLITVLFYPIITLILTVFVTNYILITVVPSIGQMLIEYDAELPLITKMVIAASDLVKNKWYFVVGGLIVLYLVARQLFRIPTVKFGLDKILLTFPLTRPVVININLARFSRTLAILLNSGIPLTRALDMAENIISNYVLMRGIIHAKDRLEQGFSLSGGLDESKYFPKAYVEIIRIGEESGLIDQVLFKMADQYTRALQQTVKRLSSLLEPVLTLFVASVVGVLMLSMFMPMVTLMRSMA